MGNDFQIRTKGVFYSRTITDHDGHLIRAVILRIVRQEMQDMSVVWNIRTPSR